MQHSVSTAAECFEAAASLVQLITANVTQNLTTAPAGCFLVASQAGVEAYFNEFATSTALCGASTGPVRSKGSQGSGDFTLSLDLDSNSGNATITLQGPADVWFGVGFNASRMADTPYTIVIDGAGTVTEHKLADHMPGSLLPPTITVVSNSVAPKPSEIRKMNHWGSPWLTANVTDVTACEKLCMGRTDCKAWTWDPPTFVTVYNMNNGVCYLRQGLSDPTGRFSGFTATGWYDGMVSGQKSNGSLRTVVLVRKLQGATANYYTFDPRLSAVQFIFAVGTTSTYQYHGNSVTICSWSAGTYPVY